ncbi:MAG: hypothetical protein AAGD34_08530 [Pseudomonadota bacterium]
MATIVVDTLVDENDGAGVGTGTSLREAILQANASGGVDEIVFDDALAGGTITLTLGEMTITDTLTIDGEINGETGPDIAISGNDLSRIFTVADDDSVNVTLTALTLADGLSADGTGGGAILHQGGALTLQTVELSQNEAVSGGAKGGAIYATSGTVDAKDTTFSDNRAEDGGGALALGVGVELLAADTFFEGNTVFGLGAAGGAIYAVEGSAIRLTHSEFVANEAYERGGAIWLLGGEIEADHVRFTENYAQFGGAIFVDDARLSLTTTQFHSNTALGLGGAVFTDSGVTSWIEDSIFSDNGTTEPDILTGGGAIYAYGGEMTIESSRFFNNFAEGSHSAGGAISAHNLEGPSNNGRLTINMSTFTGHEAGQWGGAISVINGEATITDSDIRASTTTDGDGGAIGILRGDVSVARTLILDSKSVGIGGVFYVSDGASLSLEATLVSGSSAGGGATMAFVENGGIFSATEGSSLTFGQPDGSAIIGRGTFPPRNPGFILIEDTVILDTTIGGGFGDDRINGDTFPNTLFGDAGNDSLFGDAGNDTLIGGRGDDTLLGGSGKDLLQGQQGNDSLDGGKGNDTLEGVVGRDTLFGNDGNDLLSAGRNADFVDGGWGADILIGVGGADTLLGDNGDDSLEGGGGSDWLDGGRDRDTLIGGQGSDTLIGGRQKDVMTGGSGEDVFVIAASSGTELIQDFNPNRDLIGLADGLTFEDLSFAGKNIFAFDKKIARLSDFDTTTLTEDNFTIF